MLSVQWFFISIPEEKLLKHEYFSTVVQLGRAKGNPGVTLSHTPVTHAEGGREQR